MTTPAQIAVFGGSFDPPHLGHILLAHYALAIVGVTQVIVAPTYAHAFGKSLTEFDHRMAMAKLAFADLPSVHIDPIEKQLGGTSRTFRLVEQLALRHPDHRLRVLIGADILVDAQKWERFEEVKRLAPLIVTGRAGFTHPDLDQDAPCLPEVSSSEIRDTLARGGNVSTRVPARVLKYIAEHGLYREGPGS